MLCPVDVKLDGLKVYVNGTGVNSDVRCKGLLVRAPYDRVLRVRVGGEVKSLSEFCEGAGNTTRRVQQCIMVDGTEQCLAEFIDGQSRSFVRSTARADGAQGATRAFLPSVDKRVRGMRVTLEDGAAANAQEEDRWRTCGFTTTGSRYVGLKIVLHLPESKSPPGAADVGDAGGAAGTGAQGPVTTEGLAKGSAGNKEKPRAMKMGLQEAENVVKEVCTEEFQLQLKLVTAGDAAALAAGSTSAAPCAAPAAASMATSAAAVLLQQHLKEVSQQAKVQISSRLLRQDAADQAPALPKSGIAVDALAMGVAPTLLQLRGLESMEMTREWIVQVMRCISGTIAPHYTWLTKAAALGGAGGDVSSGLATGHAQQSNSGGSGYAGAVLGGKQEPQPVCATITHWMPANSQIYESPTWGGAAVLWRCRRDDGVIEDLEEDEVRAALAAAGTPVEDMPAVEDSMLGAWKKEKASKKDRETGVEDGAREGDAEEGARGGKMLYVKNREMRPAASLAVKILGRLKSTAFAHNGMLSSRQGRQRWKKLVCERDLSKFGKSIKSLEANLVWSAVTQDFEAVRPRLLRCVDRLRSVSDAVKALKLLDGCILDTFRRKASPRDELAAHPVHGDVVARSPVAPSPIVRSISAVEMPPKASVNETSVWKQMEASRRLIAGRVGGALVPGQGAQSSLLFGGVGKAKRGIEKVRLKRGMLSVQGRADGDLGTHGREIVGKQVRIRTKCDVTGKFRWLQATVLGFEERDKVPFHCLHVLDATTPSREPIWMYLKRGNHTFQQAGRSGGNGKKKESDAIGKQDSMQVADQDGEIDGSTALGGSASKPGSSRDVLMGSGRGQGRKRGRDGSVSSSAGRLSGTASGGIIKSRLVRGVGGGGAHSASTGAAAGKSKAGAKEGQPLRAAALSSYADTEQEPPDSASPSKGEFIYIQ